MSKRKTVRQGMAWLLAATLSLVPGIGLAASEAREFRAFAVAHFHELSQVESVASFRAAVRAQFERDIAPYLREDVPNLISYPENQTLMAFLAGERGLLGRQTLDQLGAEATLVSLALPYAPQVALYAARFPGIDSPGQLLQLALTDTLARLAVEVFSELAADYGVYIAISSNLAPFERIEGPEALLYGPPLNLGGYAYRAAEPDVRNRNFLFGPDGAQLTAQDKAYLVPIERERLLGLGLLGIQPVDLPVYDLPFARVATIISKDAWMIDVNDRLEQRNAELLLQPEAFSTWGVAGGDLWPPDKFQRGGWWMLQKHPRFAVNVTPMLIGNFGDMTFDGQPFIAVEAPAGAAGGCLMGQVPEFGWAAVGGWSTLDTPAEALCDETLRIPLAERAARMLPGSGDTLENAYVSSAVFADIRLPPRPALQARASPNRDVVQRIERPGRQMLPGLGLADGRVWLSWVDTAGLPRQSVAVAAFDGESMAPAVLVDPRPATTYDHFDNQWSPAVLPRGQGALVTYLDFATENWDVHAVRLDADGSPQAPVRVDDAERDVGTIRERGHSDPKLVALSGGRVLAVWSDLRWPWIKPQVRIAFSDDDGLSWSDSLRVDSGPVDFDDEVLSGRSPGESRGQAYPAAVELSDGRIFIVWQEQGEDGIAAIWGAYGGPHGPQFSAPERLSGPTAAYRPALATEAGRVLLAWEQRDAQGGSEIMLREQRAGVWQPARAADATARPGAVQRYAQPLWLDGDWAVVYEDQRSGASDILMMRRGSGVPRRLDDAVGSAHARAPAALRGPQGGALVVWQHEDGDAIELRYTSVAERETGGGTGAMHMLLLLAAAAALRRRPASPKVATDTRGRPA